MYLESSVAKLKIRDFAFLKFYLPFVTFVLKILHLVQAFSLSVLYCILKNGQKAMFLWKIVEILKLIHNRTFAHHSNYKDRYFQN